MLKVVLCLILVACVAGAKLKWYEIDNTYNFETYLQHYGKSYTDTQEYNMRKAIFEDNLRHVIAHNQDTTKTWKEEINHLADWTDEEYSNIRGYTKGITYARKGNHVQSAPVTKSVKALPTSIDWRTMGVVTAVKDQGHCGSCWSFAAAETLESHWALKYPGKLWDLSEQQILDCTSNPQNCGGTGGCGGGTSEVAYATIIKVGGLQEEWTYPYLSYFGNNNTCELSTNTSKNNFVANMTNYVILPSNQYTPLLTAVGTVGPVAVSVDARTWRFYASGVFNGCNQTNPDLDHAVQVVGYGTENGSDYWLIRNSWTPAWGDSGYIKILRTSNVQCGTDSTPSDGSGCDNGPPSVTVCGTCGVLYDTVYPVI